MRRANRHFLPGYVWHITHRCHKKNFLLKFARDRHNYRRWVFEAKKRFGLSVLNYIVTCNHVHLLIKDTGANMVADKDAPDRETRDLPRRLFAILSRRTSWRTATTSELSRNYLGHRDVSTTMIYTDVLNRGGGGSPADRL